MTTGMTMPTSFFVTALNSLQNAMMVTPCWPSAGPTGGAGLACPAGICHLICPVIFFAIFQRLTTPVGDLAFLHLPIFQFNRCVSAENINGNFQLTPFRFHFLNDATEIKEWTVVD